MYEATHFLTAQNKVGEGAVWSPEEQALYWIDMETDCFYRLYPATMQRETFVVGDSIGVLALRATGGLIMATRRGFASWAFATNQLTRLANPEAARSDKRFNDGAIDCKGRFWAGSMREDEVVDPTEGTLYRFDPDGSAQTMDDGLILPNGIVWNAANTLMYLTDSLAKAIYVYDFEAENGAISNRRPFVATPEASGLPDGLTIDDEDFLWSASWGGGKITRYDPAGKIERVIHLPVPQVTSCAFGGPERNELFITSAWAGLSEADLRRYPLSGDLFHLYADVTGQPRPKFLG